MGYTLYITGTCVPGSQCVKWTVCDEWFSDMVDLDLFRDVARLKSSVDELVQGEAPLEKGSVVILKTKKENQSIFQDKTIQEKTNSVMQYI